MTNTANMPRVLLTATSSGSGKTTITSGLLRALSRRGLKVASYKSGPDYIDPMFHRSVLNTPCRNIDLYFSTEDEARTLLAESSEGFDIAVLEGVMGFYDGLGGRSTTSSSYHVAATTDTPVVLIVDGRGVSLTLAATIKGIKEFREDSHVAGVIINRCSKGMFMLFSQFLEEECGVKPLGYVPYDPEIGLESRHLGLVTAQEVGDLQSKIDRVADVLEESVDLDALIELARSANPLAFEPSNVQPVTADEPVIAVAQDEAFCFYYEESLEHLRRLGAKLEFFSPIDNEAIPANADALYLGGGYPELRAQDLSNNASMIASMRAAREAGMPILAECGGFMYLKESLEDTEGVSWPMTGILPGGAHYTGKLSRFGYIEMTAQQAGFGMEKGAKMRAHEFHYYDTDDNGTAFHAAKPLSKRSWDCCFLEDRLYAGFPHMYLPACPDIAAGFVRAAAAYKAGEACS